MFIEINNVFFAFWGFYGEYFYAFWGVGLFFTLLIALWYLLGKR